MMTIAMVLFMAAAASADVLATDVDAIVPEGKIAVEESFEESLVETSAAMVRVKPEDIKHFNAKLESSSAALEKVVAQAKKKTAASNAERKKSEWDAARFKANTHTTLRTFPADEFPVLVESTFSQCVYRPTGFGEAPVKEAPASAKAQKKYAKHYKTLCAGEISMKAEKRESKEKAIQLREQKCADNVEKSQKESESTTKSFKKTQVNEKVTKKEAEHVKELQNKLREAKNKNNVVQAPLTPAPESPELCSKQGIAAEKYAKHNEKLQKADEVTAKAKSAKESASKAAEAKDKQEKTYKEVAKKSGIEKTKKKSEKDEKCADKVDVKEATMKGAERGGKGDVKEELEKAKHKEVLAKDSAETDGKEKAQKSAEAVSKTAMYEKRIKKELSDKKSKHDEVLELQEKAQELKKKHPKGPDFDEQLEKSKEIAFKGSSQDKEKAAKWEIKLKKSTSDSDEMKEKNESFNKAEKTAKSAEAKCKKDEAEASTKQEKNAKESTMKLQNKGAEGTNKVKKVQKGEQHTKEKHAKDPFYNLDKYAKKVSSMHEVFDKTKAAYERKCKVKEQEIETKADYKLKTEEAMQESEVKATAKTTKELEAKTEKTTKEKVMKVEGAAESLEKATNERCDKTTASSELSDKFEVKKWSSKLKSFQEQCDSVKEEQERDQKVFVVDLCAAAHHQMETAASGISVEVEDTEAYVQTPSKEELEKAVDETEGESKVQAESDVAVMPPPTTK